MKVLGQEYGSSEGTPSCHGRHSSRNSTVLGRAAANGIRVACPELIPSITNPITIAIRLGSELALSLICISFLHRWTWQEHF